MALTIHKKLTKYNFTDSNNPGRIKYIIIHYVGATGGAEANCNYYASGYVGASAHYYVGFSGEIWQSVPDEDIAWSVGASSYVHPYARNSNTLNIEICVRKKSTATMNATDKDWYFEDASVTSAIALTKMLMQKYNIPVSNVLRHYDVTGKICPNPYVYNHTKHTWSAFKAALTGASDVTVEDTYYRVGTAWKDGKCINQLGAYTVKANAIKNCPSGYKVYDSKGKAVYTAPIASGTQASAFKGLSEKEVANKILKMAREDMLKSGVLASVTAAQMILESGYVTTDLAVNANNCFGMKTVLSNNTWDGSMWDGKSTYTKVTKEEYTPGVITNVVAAFRKYPCIEHSVYDHSSYLLGATVSPTKLRYAGLQGERDYKKAITIIKNGGYATDSKYIEKICNIIERFGLNKYDSEMPNATPVPVPTPTQTYKYKVGDYVNCSSYYNKAKDGVTKAIIKSLSGTITKIAKGKANPYQIDGKYYVNDGDIRSKGKESAKFVPYSVHVSTNDLRIRSGAGTNYAQKGYTHIGTFGIVAEKKDANGKLWGKLKSGVGWIALYLDCVKKV